ncbi:MAG: ABC transporter substrate-binding protein [Prevotella sp.]|nr:ABC transporter substrate-binding protein [Prevotella sp.]
MNRILYALLLGFTLASCGGRGNGTLAPADGESDDSSLVAVDAAVYKGLMYAVGIGDKCVDFSDQAVLDPERLVASGAKILLLSSYGGADADKYRRAGIKVIECDDFNAPTALERVRRLTEYAARLGAKSKADSLYRVVEMRYDSLCRSVTEDNVKPEVMFDLVYGNIWYQPTKGNATGEVTVAAGGSLPFPGGGTNGVRALTRERMLAEAGDADVWIIRYAARDTLSLSALARLDPVYKRFKAFRTGNVFACNTAQTNYFEEAPLRPDYLLEDLIHILHPAYDPVYRLRYFTRLK